MYVVYALIDPRDESVFYVGVTEDVYTRFLQHINCAGGNFEKNVRIMELRTQNKLVIMQELDRSEDKNWVYSRETYWIKHFELLGAPLANKAHISGRTSPVQSYRKKMVQVAAKVARKVEGVTKEASDQKQFTPDLEADFVRRFKATGSIKESLAQMHISYGRYQRHASQIVQERHLRKGL